METSATFLEAPERLLAAHDRLRSSDFPVVSLVSAQSPLDARVWLGRWARSRGRHLIVSPSVDCAAVHAAFRTRVPHAEDGNCSPTAALLVLTGAFRASLEVAHTLTRRDTRLPLALPCGIGAVVDGLLDEGMAQHLVGAALQGLVPVGDTSQQVLKTVAEARKVPLLRGPSEGILYYMLEARTETRGRFNTNVRLPSTLGNRRHEVDLCCETAKLIIEIDGREHDQTHRRIMDSTKQQDLQNQGFRVRRFSNATVIDDPVAVWRDIAACLAA